MSKFVETHLPCPDCGSSDALAVREDGSTLCYSCKTNTNNGEAPAKVKKPDDVVYNGKAKDLTERHIPKDICQKFGYIIGEHKGEVVHFAPFHDEDGNLVGTKVRGKNKKFYSTGNVDNHLFGRKLWGAGGRRLVITEGELDALAYATATDGRWPVVSIPSGAGSAIKSVKKNLSYIESFKEVVLLFDNDEPGQKAARDVAAILRPGLVKIANILKPHKDACDVLKEGKVNELLTCVWNAETYRPDGIVNAKDLWHLVSRPREMGMDYPFKCLNESLYGMRPREIVTLTAGTGIGKSTICAEIAYHLIRNKKEKVGYVALEEGLDVSTLRFMALELNQPIHLPGYVVSDEDRKRSFDATAGTGLLHLDDHFGSMGAENLMTKIRYLIVGLGCKYIFLDHLSIVVSAMNFDDGLSERQEIDKIMTELRQLCENTGASLILVSHLKRIGKGRSHEDGGKISLGHLRGSQAISQISDAVIGVERNQQSSDQPNLMRLRILKNRYAGTTGLVGGLDYDAKTGRITEVDDYGPDDDSEDDEDF